MNRLTDAEKAWLTKSCQASEVPVIITDPATLTAAAETLRPARRQVTR